MRIQQLNHSVYQLQYHIVWGTKYRRKVLKHYVRTELVKAIYKILRRHPDWYLYQINTGDDHVHIRIEISPVHSLAAVVQEIKSNTSKELRSKFKFINEIYDHSGIWGVGYFVSSIGLNEDQIRRYIEKQNNYDRGVDVSAEFS
jgi:putative transposase